MQFCEYICGKRSFSFSFCCVRIIQVQMETLWIVTATTTQRALSNI